jgi:hypothetical protein
MRAMHQPALFEPRQIRRMLAGEAANATVRPSIEVLPSFKSSRRISFARLSVFEDMRLFWRS